MQHDHTAIVEIIRSGNWFEGVSKDAIELLAKRSRVKKFAANQYLYLIGEQTNHIYCVLSGRVRVSITSSDGQEFVLTDMMPDSWLGEASLAGPATRVQEIWVLEDADVLMIPSDVVLKVAEDNPSIYRNLFLDVVSRTRAMYGLLAGMLFYPLRSRLAGRLLDLAQKRGETMVDGIELDVGMSQLDFARMSMGSRQRINKIFRSWVKQGVLEKSGDKYKILNLVALQKELKLEED